jgi:hypothetical protein
MEFTSYQPGQVIEGNEPLPDERHECIIVSAADKYDNDGSRYLRVVFQPVKGADVYAWPAKKIYDRSGKEGADFAATVADALRIDRSHSLDLDPGEMVGRKVLVSTRQWTTPDGKVIALVEAVRGTWTARGGAIPAAPAREVQRITPNDVGIIAPAAPATIAAPKPRTPAAAVAAARGDEAGGSDDVPF